MSEDQKLEQLSVATGIEVDALRAVKGLSARTLELKLMRAELKAKQNAARAMRAAVKVAKAAYQAENFEHQELKTLAAMDRAEAREASAKERLAAYQVRTAKLRANQEKLDRLEAQKRAMNGSREGARSVQSTAGRVLAQDQIARTHGASDDKPRWEPRPEPKYMP